MRKAMKPAVIAGLLGSAALMALGAVNAHADDGDGEQCTRSGNVIRCSYANEYNYTTDDGRSVTVVSNQTLTCSGSNPLGAATREADGGREVSAASGTVCSQNGRTYRP